MITKTYICDKCNSSVGESELCTVEITIKSPQPLTHSNSYRKNEVTKAEKHICKECLDRKGIRVVLPENEKKEKFDKQNEVCLEDKIMEFLQDLGVLFED